MPSIDLEPLETHFQYNLLDTFVALFPSLVGAIVIGLGIGNTAKLSFSFSPPVNSEKYSEAHIYSKYQYVLLELVKLSTNLPPYTGLVLFSGPWRPAILIIIVVLPPKILMSCLSIPNM